MIGFVTLFLGVFFGIREVEVAPAADIARVELRLDDVVVATLEKPPWKAKLDFGVNPLPRLLVAVARAADGRELGRAEQWVNRATPMASASLALLQGDPPAVRLSWEAVTGAKPETLTVTCDGQPLDVSDPTRIPLPKTALLGTKLVRASLEFPGLVRAGAELLLGTGVRDSADTALTAVLVTVPKGELPPPAALRGFFEAEGKPLEVVAWEKGPAEVHVVAERSARVLLLDGGEAFWGQSWVPPARDMKLTKLPKGSRFRVMVPVALESASERTRYRVFPGSPRYGAEEAGVIRVLWAIGAPPAKDGPPLVREAVAASGLALSGDVTRRVVVLLLGPQPKDTSGLSDEGVRGLLSAIEVPYRVLNLVRARPSGWGEPKDAFTIRLLESSIFQIGEELERQRIVWVTGRHRPGSVKLTAKASNLALAR